MKFLIVSNAPIIKKKEGFFAYCPYVKEMEIWAKYSDEVAICSPRWEKEKGLFVSEIPFQIHKNFWLSDFNIRSVKSLFRTLFQVPFNFFVLFKAMVWADHIHLRCPGNVGLLGSFVQIFFPWKKKTAKYAGNWDPKAQQPWSYRLQRWLLSNTFLTRNMQVLVYGEWLNQSQNIKPFFTASYAESDTVESIVFRDFSSEIQFLFVGTLSKGKRPLYAVELVEALIKKGCKAKLAVLGEGKMRDKIIDYCETNQLNDCITLHGNKELTFVKALYQTSHFLILPSQSEGWPKVVAESMFWGCVPVATPISCVPFMLDYGNRGVLLEMNMEQDVLQLENLILNPIDFNNKQKEASNWSRNYTLDGFETEIKQLVCP